MLEYAVGERIDDRYRVEQQLGAGGMGATYRAIDERTGDDVVVKIPSRALIGDPAAFTRFERERKIGELLDHPRIQRFLRAGQFAGGAPYLVFAYVPGIPMRRYLSERAPLPVNEAVRMATQVADALACAHEHGVVHRDVKPENLLRTHSGDVVLLDFGIAFLKGARRITFQRLSNEVGTPDYMAPEQVRGERGDARTDEYALGVLLYEMLTGAVPFGGDNALAVMGQRLAREAPSVRLRRADAPWQLDSVVRRALQTDPAGRYATMAEMRDALSRPSTVDAVAPQRALTGFWQVGPMPSAARAAIIVFLTLAGLVALGVVAQLIHQAQVR